MEKSSVMDTMTSKEGKGMFRLVSFSSCRFLLLLYRSQIYQYRKYTFLLCVTNADPLV
jgi:hypothetical protein